jgi:phage protein D
MSFVSVVDIPRAVGDFRDFYVPRFEIRIAGADLPGEVLRDVTQLTYHDNLQEIDGFELTVNNWNEVTQDFKYLGSGLESSAQEDLQRIFDPCNKDVAISFGYGDDVQPIVAGNFTTIEPSFPPSGPATMAVRGLNVLHRLRRKQYTTAWVAKKDSEIAENLATLNDPQTGHRRFPVPIVTSSAARSNEDQIAYVSQRSQYDIDFLFRRARERGYVVAVRPRAGGRGANDVELYFGPSTAATPGRPEVEYELGWRKSLIDFKPTLTTANQVRSVTVNGWNRGARTAIAETVSIDDPRLNINRDLRQLLAACDPREEVVVDEPMFTAHQARERALAILMDRQRSVVRASGTCIGLPGLRAGKRVSIVGLGTTFSGVYYLTSTTHTINEGGYTVRFEARREDTGSGGAAGGGRS